MEAAQVSSTPSTPSTPPEVYTAEVPKDSIYDKNQRFSVKTEHRILGFTGAFAIFGMFDGFYRGFNNTSLVYLAENSHRFPRTVGGWYFYHKRKNYVCIKEGLVSGFKFSTKLAAISLLYFGSEATLDYYRGQIDFVNTSVVTGLAAGAYGFSRKFNGFQVRSLMKKGFAIGLVSGLAQDAFTYVQGGDVWYVNRFM